MIFKYIRFESDRSRKIVKSRPDVDRTMVKSAGEANARGYHAIFHCYGHPGGDVGGYAWSVDGREWNAATNWSSNPELPFTDTIAQADGSTQKYYQSQRSKLFLNEDGTPAALITGLDAKSKPHPEPWQKYCVAMADIR